LNLSRAKSTDSVGRAAYPAIADAILGHGEKKKSLQNLCLTISDDDLVGAVERMKFDIGETEIRVRWSRPAGRMNAAAPESLD
jgi:hypothetical protein